jgi:hypothetical protein
MALQAAGYDGCEALVMHVAVGGVPREFARTRAWTAEQWSAAAESLRGRGLIDADEVATQAGRDHREAVEHQTDVLALAPHEALGEDGCLRLRELVKPLSLAIAAEIYPRATQLFRPLPAAASDPISAENSGRS